MYNGHEQQELFLITLHINWETVVISAPLSLRIWLLNVIFCRTTCFVENCGVFFYMLPDSDADFGKNKRKTRLWFLLNGNKVNTSCHLLLEDRFAQNIHRNIHHAFSCHKMLFYKSGYCVRTNGICEWILFKYIHHHICHLPHEIDLSQHIQSSSWW